MADHLEPAGHILQHLGHVGADLAQGAATACAGAIGRAMLDLPARQVLGQRLAAAANVFSGRRFVRRVGPGSISLGRLRLQLLQRQFKLCDLVSQALRRLAELHAPEPGQLGAQMLGLQRLVAQPGLSHPAGRPLRRQVRQQRADHGAQGGHVVREVSDVDGPRHARVSPAPPRRGNRKCGLDRNLGPPVGRGVRQSRPSSSMASWAAVSDTVPLRARVGHRNRPCSKRLENRHIPCPSHHNALTRSPRLPRNRNRWPEKGSSRSTCCTCAASPSNPRRMSVLPRASGCAARRVVRALSVQGRREPPERLGRNCLGDPQDPAVAQRKLDDRHRGPGPNGRTRHRCRPRRLPR